MKTAMTQTQALAKQMHCRYCGRAKNWYTSRSRFGDGCKQNPKGSWHFYIDREVSK